MSPSLPTTTNTVLTSIANWSQWRNDLKTIAESLDVWDCIDPTDRRPWIPKPDNSASDRARKRYEDERVPKQAVHTWIIDHVSPTLSTIIRETPNANPAVFYDQLVKHLDVTPERILMEMQDKYDKAMLSMSTKPSDFGDWVQNWGLTMTSCRQHGLQAATAPSQWWRDLKKNITSVLPAWPNAFFSANIDSILASTITFERVVADLSQQEDMVATHFHRGAALMATATRTQQPRTMTFRNRSTTTAKKRKFDCAICDLPNHSSDTCYYLHEAKRPAWFKPRPDISAHIVAEMRKPDSEINRICKRIKNNRSEPESRPNFIDPAQVFKEL